MNKLSELSRKTLAEVLASPKEKLAWRLHEINWHSKNVPLKRNNLTWIDKAYIENEAEYPMQQFQLTTGIGRVIGFFDENRIFNVVLLDPHHNMQPSSYSDYRLRATAVADSPMAKAMVAIEARIASCKADACECRAAYGEIQAIFTADVPGPTLVVGVDEVLFDRATKCVEDGVARTISELIAMGLDGLEK